MKLINWVSFGVVFTYVTTCYAISITINTDDFAMDGPIATDDTIKKEEAKKPEPPKRATLSIHALNGSRFDLIVFAKASVNGHENQEIIIHGKSPANSSIILANQFAEPNSTFKITDGGVLILLPNGEERRVSCTLEKTSPDAQALKSIDFELKTDPGHIFPSCKVYYDFSF